MATRLARQLELRSAEVVAEARTHPIYRLATAQDTDGRVVRAALRNVLLRVHLYGPHLTRSVFHAVGRIAAFDLDAARVLITLECDEAPHPQLAFADYVRLGGKAAHKDDLTLSPAAFAVAAVADLLARHENPFAFLGFLYLLESTTPALIEGIAPSLEAHGRGTATEFLPLHRTQDCEHAATLLGLIDGLAKKDPATGRAVAFGLECFAVVYPLPVWSEALAQAERETAGRR